MTTLTIAYQGIQETLQQGIRQLNAALDEESPNTMGDDTFQPLAILEQNAKVIQEELNRLNSSFLNRLTQKTKIADLESMKKLNQIALDQLSEYLGGVFNHLSYNSTSNEPVLDDSSGQDVHMQESSKGYLEGFVDKMRDWINGLFVQTASYNSSSLWKQSTPQQNQSSSSSDIIQQHAKDQSLPSTVVVENISQSPSSSSDIISQPFVIIEDREAVLRNFTASFDVLSDSNPDLSRLTDELIKYIFQPDKISRIQLNIETLEFSIEYKRPVEMVLGKILGMNAKLILPKKISINFENDMCNFISELPTISTAIKTLATVSSIAFSNTGVRIASSRGINELSTQVLINKLESTFGEESIRAKLA